MEIRLATDTTVARLLPLFERIRAREDHGGYKFPTTADIVTASHSLVSAGADITDVAVAAQQDWFRRGQTGCVFARLAAIKHGDEAWPYLVVLDPDEVHLVDERLSTLCDEPSAQVASIVFPNCSTLGEFLRIMDELVTVSSFWYSDVAATEDSVTFQLRRPIAPGVEAWVMAFGPDTHLPSTRRAPFYEFVIRVKRKSGEEYHRLNQDPTAAHLADFPLRMPAGHWDDRWDSTKRRTTAILGHEPDKISAARSTLTVPRALVDDQALLTHRNTRI